MTNPQNQTQHKTQSHSQIESSRRESKGFKWVPAKARERWISHGFLRPNPRPIYLEPSRRCSLLPSHGGPIGRWCSVAAIWPLVLGHYCCLSFLYLSRCSLLPACGAQNKTRTKQLERSDRLPWLWSYLVCCSHCLFEEWRVFIPLFFLVWPLRCFFYFFNFFIRAIEVFGEKIEI